MPLFSSLHVIGGGPSGLMAAETLARAGWRVTLFDRMPTFGRKLLIAGHGGLNLTKDEPLDVFLTRYGAAAKRIEGPVRAFSPEALRHWCADLGQETFVGSSGRVFPVCMKASPLLRAWLRRLSELGVSFKPRHRWLGQSEKGENLFTDENGNPVALKARATLLALGGASWPQLGSDGAWVDILEKTGLPVAPLRPANCGFIVPWSDLFAQRFAGLPLKPVCLTFGEQRIQGEIMLTQRGIEGGAVYALSRFLRDEIEAEGCAELTLDLRPSLTEEALANRLHKPRGSQSLATFLRKAGGMEPQAIALLREVERQGHAAPPETPEALAQRIKALPLKLTATAGLKRAISSAGGLSFAALDERFMVRTHAGLFAAGEMLDWEAPTGGYLLQASLATGRAAAEGMLQWLAAGK